MIIRKAKPKDVNKILILSNEFNEAIKKITPKKFMAYRKFVSPEKETIRKAILKDIRKKNGLFLVAEENSKLLGYIFGTIGPLKKEVFDTPLTGELEDIVVSKKYRGKGIATKLWRELQKYFKKQNCKFYQLSVGAKNPAKKIYEKWGFEDVLVKMRQKI